MFNHHVALAWWRPRYESWTLYQEMLGTDQVADGLELLAASVVLWTHINVLQENKIWNSCRNDYSEKDITIVLSKAGALICDWLVPIPEQWETSTDLSLDQAIPPSVRELVKVLGRPRVHTLS